MNQGKEITAELFRKATGRQPIQDDLDRCNCPHAGKIGHTQCGWNEVTNLPQFMTNFRRGNGSGKESVLRDQG